MHRQSNLVDLVIKKREKREYKSDWAFHVVEEVFSVRVGVCRVLMISTFHNSTIGRHHDRHM